MAPDRHHATLFFALPEPLAAAIHGALLPETARSGEVPRTAGTVRLAPGGLRIDVRADDLGSLRAALNSYLRWTDAAAKAATAGAPTREPGDPGHAQGF